MSNQSVAGTAICASAQSLTVLLLGRVLMLIQALGFERLSWVGLPFALLAWAGIGPAAAGFR